VGVPDKFFKGKYRIFSEKRGSLRYGIIDLQSVKYKEGVSVITIFMEAIPLC
jgi:hypothetical protein